VKETEMAIKNVTIFRVALPPFIFCLLVLSILEFIVRGGFVASYLVPPPSLIVIDIIENPFMFFNGVLVTGIESVFGFVFAAVFAFGLSLIFAMYSSIDRSVFPLLVALKCMPLVAFAPILGLWFGGGSMVAKGLLAGFICFFPIIVNLRTGLNTIDQEALDLFQSLSSSRWSMFWKLLFPSAMPYYLSGLKTSSTLAVIGAVVGEFANSDKGLGFIIMEASYQGNAIRMFSSVLILMLLGLFLFGIMSLIDLWVRKILRIDLKNGLDR